VLNFQAARSSDTIVLTESVLDALSFQQAEIATAIPSVEDQADALRFEFVRQASRRARAGAPRDKAGESFRCMRECMERHGCPY
jgi:hypothetical protein